MNLYSTICGFISSVTFFTLIMYVVFDQSRPLINPKLHDQQKPDAADLKYCNLTSCKGKRHVTCQYPAEPNPECGTIIKVGLEPHEERKLLDYIHGLFSPSESPVPGLTWNKELATLAQRWVHQCPPEIYDECRNTPSMKVEQSIFKEYNRDFKKTEPISLIQKMYEYPVVIVQSFDSTEYNNNNNIGARIRKEIFKDATSIGCGYILYRGGNKKEKYVFIGFLVCNHGPVDEVLYS